MTTQEIKTKVSRFGNSLKRPDRFSRNQLIVFAVIFAAIGGYILFRTFAAAPVVATLQGEQMNLPAGTRDSQEVWNGTSSDYNNPSGFGKVSLAGALSAPTGPGIVATTVTHTVDGQLNESDWALTQTIAKSVIGTGNNTATFGAAWDSKYLYLGAKVLDSSLKNDSAQCWDDDSVEFYIDPNNDGGTKYDSLDKQLTQRWNDSSLCGNNGASTAGVLHAWANISGGYSVELAVPWTSLGITPSAGKTLGIDAAYNDDDNGGSRDAQAVWNGTINDYKDPSGFGHLQLLAAASSAVPGAVAPVTTTHTTDGNLSESDWNVSTPIAKSVIGTANNKATYGAMWDSKYLYVGVKVLDSSIHKDSTNCWDDDSVELYIDPTNAGGTTYTSQDKQLTQRWNDSALCGNSAATTAGVLHGWANITGGYSVEFAVPWTSLGVSPSTGMTIGLDVGVNDDDGAGMIYADSTASNGQALALTKAATATSSINLASTVTSLNVLAHSNACGSGWPTMTVAIDGASAISAASVSSTSWTTYSANVNLAAGTHNVTVTYANAYADATCSRNLDLDSIVFYGPSTVTPPPVVSLSANPASISTGSASTLTWSATNATSCSAPWTTSTATSGTSSVSPTSTTTYTMTCTGGGGTASQNTTVTVSGSTGGGTGLLPKYNISIGSKLSNEDATHQDLEMSNDKALSAGMIRLGYWNPSYNAPAIQKALDNGFQVELIIGDTVTAPGPGTAAYASLATTAITTWKGKIHYFELMNEPDLNGWTADTYVPYLKAGYNAIKAVDPTAVVWHGGMWDKNSPTTFLIDWMSREYALGAKNYFDAFNFHCYGNNTQHGSWAIWDMVYGSGGAGFYDNYNVRSVMTANGDGAKPTVCTEGGNTVNNVSLTEQANDVTLSLKSVDGIGTGYRKTQAMFIYTTLDNDVPGFGLLDANNNKRPAWTAFYNVTHGL